jgi:hypothetical protein
MIKTEGTEDASAVESETHSVYFEQRLNAQKMLQLLRVKLTLSMLYDKRLKAQKVLQLLRVKLTLSIMIKG